MTFLLPAGILAVMLTVPIIVLHMLAPRRPPTHVSSLLHWDGLRHSITAATPWQRLRFSLLLILQLLLAILLAIALARPAVLEEATLAEHTVFIVDTSSSMTAIDGTPDRLGAAIAAAIGLRADAPDGGTASIVLASNRPSIVMAHNSDRSEFSRIITSVRPSPSGVDYEATFALAESLSDPDRATGYVLISDGHLTPLEQRLAPLGTQFVPVGAIDTNRAITALSATVGPGVLTARVTVENTGGPTALQNLHLFVDGQLVRTELIEVPRDSSVERVYELPLGGRLSAILEGEDLLAADNERHAVAPRLGVLKARVFGENTFFVDQLLAALPDVEIETSATAEVDFEIYVGVAVSETPTLPFIAIDVPRGVPGVTPSGRIEFPVPTMIADDPLLDEIDFSRIAIASAQALHVEGVTVLVGAPGAPLVVRGEIDEIPFFYLAFTLEQSNLPVNIAYPILGARMVGALASSSEVAAGITVGQPIPVLPAHVNVIDPRGSEIRIVPGDSAPLANATGFWVVESDDGARFDIAVNPDTSESRLAPVRELPDLRPAVSGPDDSPTASTVARSILPWFILAILILLVVELIVSYRRRGVSRTQWNAGLAVRLLIVGLLLLTLIDPLVAKRSSDVTTVFVVDVSASIGTTKDLAREWVDDALSQAANGRWAVVEFGTDARMAANFDTVHYGAARGVDPNATSISRGLRLGASLLTGETRQRLVLVSDGRPNSGDLQAEIDRLQELGIVVDVHTISGEQLTDVAVARIDTPSRVNSGESYTATATLTSTTASPATVHLYDNGRRVQSVNVDLVRGDTTVRFQVTPSEIGLQILDIEVVMPGDLVRENNQAEAGVEVAGPASVLILEGELDNAAALELALQASGIDTRRLPVSQIPDLAGLAVYQAVVLVDASVWDIGHDGVEALDTYVRDLGRGMIVLGGPRSYGAGAYHDTEFEAMLPIDSEALDPTRRAEVAQVLLIDTSESMGACHCTNGVEVDRSGIVKTDIAKAAVLQAFSAIGPRDEFGVLAFTGSSRWILPLQEGHSFSTVEQEVGALQPIGDTRIRQAVEQGAISLRQSDKELKHMILFTDGFSSELPGGFGEPGTGIGQSPLMAAVQALAAEGITVSVVSTGEGAIEDLEQLAEAGRGRFYPGRDLDEIPEIFVNESRLASRSYITEGEFFPVVTSSSETVANLTESPALLGYIAATPKPTSDVMLQVGSMGDPLLATWTLGLGRVTAWTSDAGSRWASLWADWDGFTEFWSGVIRDTFPLAGAEGQRVRAVITEGVMSISLEGAEAWAPGTAPTARVRNPDGSTTEARLSRVSDFEFIANVPALEDGSYSVGVAFDRGDGESAILSAIASRSFSAEFIPGEPNSSLMANISSATGGRGEIEASQAFDPGGLEDGVINRSLRWWFLFAATLLWPIDVALRRLRLSKRARRRQRSTGSQPQPTPTTP